MLQNKRIYSATIFQLGVKKFTGNKGLNKIVIDISTDPMSVSGGLSRPRR